MRQDLPKTSSRQKAPRGYVTRAEWGAQVQQWATNPRAEKFTSDAAAILDWTGATDRKWASGADGVLQRLDAGLARRVGRNMASFDASEWRAYHALGRELLRLRRLERVRNIEVVFADQDAAKACRSNSADFLRELDHLATRENCAAANTLEPRRTHEVCECGEVFAKSRSDANYCLDCKRADSVRRFVPSARLPNHLVQGMVVWHDGAKWLRYLGFCVDCSAEFEYETTTSGGKPRSYCDECRTPAARKRRERAK